MNKKDEQLGTSHGAASSKLRKMLLFAFVQDVCLDACFRCGRKITKLSEFSIEHKEAWQDSDDPRGRFFDLQNIAFSHLRCNVSHTSQRSKSGYLGVTHRPEKKNPWQARIRIRGKTTSLGCYSTAEEASGVYQEALAKLK